MYIYIVFIKCNYNYSIFTLHLNIVFNAKKCMFAFAKYIINAHKFFKCIKMYILSASKYISNECECNRIQTSPIYKPKKKKMLHYKKI